MNIAKNDNAKANLIIEVCLNFICLFEIFLINLSTEISTTVLMTFYYLTKNKGKLWQRIKISYKKFY